MLGQKAPMATLAVRDIAAARRFYEGKLGLTPGKDQMEGMASYASAGATLFIYQSEFAGTNRATAVTWMVGGDLEDIVKDLKGKGIAFEHYDMPGTTREGDIHVFDANNRAAWFKDPDGNIHALVSG